MSEVERRFRRLCVFCGSSSGLKAEYGEIARELGVLLARKKITLVYGGGNIGLMGELARTVLDLGGEVIGIIPRRIHEKVDSLKLTELHVVEDMHQRKARMYDLADGFLILPGGIGTVEEFFEIYTWYQLGLHLKPIGLLNVREYFTQLICFLQHTIDEGFFKQAYLDALVIEADPQDLLGAMQTRRMVYIEKLG